MKIGYFLSSEEFGPAEQVRQAQRAQQAGMDRLWISDHYHPWLDEQGQSPFVWTAIGAIAQATDGVHVTTGVTCPTLRIHPAIVAHAAATCSVLLDGRFTLGVGTGEALNEHILGTHWPEAEVRLEMLEEAIEVMRLLWQGGQQSHRGRHYTVENARLYTLPGSPPDVLVSAFGPKAMDVAARVGDGLCLGAPSADDVADFRRRGGTGPVHAGMKVCVGDDAAAARATAHRLWRQQLVPGELNQLLPTPSHFAQASELVTEDMVADQIVCGPDLDAIRERIQRAEQAGVDELYIQQIGEDQEAFFTAYERELAPGLAG